MVGQAISTAGTVAVHAVRDLLNPPTDTATRIIQRNGALQGLWAERNKSMNKWYKAVQLENYLEQEDMESYITNQPKNAFRFARHLITTSAVHDRVNREGFTADADPDFDKAEAAMRQIWEKLEDRSENAGRQGWMWEIAGIVAAFGWYAVFVETEEDDLFADVWNPHQVYPLWHPRQGLIEVVRNYTTDKASAQRNLEIMGATVPNSLPQVVQVYNYWEKDADDNCFNTLVYNNSVIKDKENIGLPYIPVITGPASGMPDEGVVLSNAKWAGEWGEAVVAHNMEVLVNFNKMTSYVMQTARDAANPRWVEYVNSGNSILDPEYIFKRGAIFTAENDERVDALAGPVLPIEATTTLRDMRADLGSGSFNDVMLGDVAGSISAVALSTMVGNTRHLIDPYTKAIAHIRKTAAQWWWDTMSEKRWKPYDIKVSYTSTKHIKWETTLALDIPGDFINRATQARMVSPEWEMSQERTTEILFPGEIKDPIREQARRNAERANRHPVAVDMQLIHAYEQNAIRARAANDLAAAARWKKAAAAIEKNLGQRVGGQQPDQVGPITQVVPQSNPFKAE